MVGTPLDPLSATSGVLGCPHPAAGTGTRGSEGLRPKSNPIRHGLGKIHGKTCFPRNSGVNGSTKGWDLPSSGTAG